MNRRQRFQLIDVPFDPKDEDVPRPSGFFWYIHTLGYFSRLIRRLLIWVDRASGIDPRQADRASVGPEQELSVCGEAELEGEGYLKCSI